MSDDLHIPDDLKERYEKNLEWVRDCEANDHTGYPSYWQAQELVELIERIARLERIKSAVLDPIVPKQENGPESEALSR